MYNYIYQTLCVCIARLRGYLSIMIDCNWPLTYICMHVYVPSYKSYWYIDRQHEMCTPFPMYFLASTCRQMVSISTEYICVGIFIMTCWYLIMYIILHSCVVKLYNVQLVLHHLKCLFMCAIDHTTCIYTRYEHWLDGIIIFFTGS